MKRDGMEMTEQIVLTANSGIFFTAPSPVGENRE
jgi:hypothetical protein